MGRAEEYRTERFKPKGIRVFENFLISLCELREREIKYPFEAVFVGFPKTTIKNSEDLSSRIEVLEQILCVKAEPEENKW